MKKSLALLLHWVPVLLIGGCTFIAPQPGADKVTISQPERVSYCLKLGSTKVNALEKIGPIERNPLKLQDDLEALARNATVDMAGDTLVPATAIRNGQQTFNVYRCRR